MTKTPNFTPTFQTISISVKLTHQQLKKMNTPMKYLICNPQNWHYEMKFVWMLKIITSMVSTHGTQHSTF